MCENEGLGGGGGEALLRGAALDHVQALWGLTQPNGPKQVSKCM